MDKTIEKKPYWVEFITIGEFGGVEYTGYSKEYCIQALCEGGVDGVVEGLAHTWMAPYPLGVCSAVLPLFFLLPTESETSPRHPDMFQHNP